MQRRAERRERVVHARRHDRVDGAVTRPSRSSWRSVTREHPLADAVDLAAQLGEAQRPAVEQGDHEQRPLVGDAVEDLADLAVLPGVPLESSRLGDGTAAVTGDFEVPSSMPL